MIQRIQTVYLTITLICLGFVSFGTHMFSFLSTTMRYKVDAFGITQGAIADDKFVNHEGFPGYLIGIGLMLITLVTIISFKDLKRQHRFGRMLFYTYFVVLASVMVMINFGGTRISSDISGREMDLGFFLLVVGFPFVFLANTGINRDKKLLDSLNRLR
jgi:hypothetical protein